MARLPKEEEQRWRYRIQELMEAGHNHHQAAKIMEEEGTPGSTRPQNIKRVMEKLKRGEYSPSEIVSPAEQREKLEETTERIFTDLDELDYIIKSLVDNPQDNAAKLEKFYKLKNELYKNLVSMWSISDSISGSSKQPSSIKGDKVQINYANVDRKLLAEAAKAGADKLNEALSE
jgi:hypothetical protein